MYLDLENWIVGPYQENSRHKTVSNIERTNDIKEGCTGKCLFKQFEGNHHMKEAEFLNSSENTTPREMVLFLGKPMERTNKLYFGNPSKYKNRPRNKTISNYIDEIEGASSK